MTTPSEDFTAWLSAAIGTPATPAEPEQPTPRRPRPDPSQGSGGNRPPDIDPATAFTQLLASAGRGHSPWQWMQ